MSGAHTYTQHGHGYRHWHGYQNVDTWAL